MKYLFSILFLFFWSVAPSVQAQTTTPKLITWQDLMQLPTPALGQKIAYGKDSLQFGELRLPSEGKGPFPVVVVIHGGCWLAQYNYQYMNHVSDALTKAGYATWNIEFRRVGNPGGGWPGTFLDVAQGVDFVRELAKQYPVNPKKVVLMGHSAGGHLALWASARKNIAKSSELYTKNPLKVKGVVALAGIPDLATYASAPGSCNSAVPQLMGGLPSQVPARYAQGSPMQLKPGNAILRLVQGAKDPIVPITQAQNFVDHVKKSHKGAQVLLLPNAGHFDLVTPTSPVWPTIEQEVKNIFSQNK